MSRKLKLGLFGLGHLGKIHLNCIKNIPEIELVGCYDIQQDPGKEICAEQGVKFFENPDELMDQSEALDIVTPTISHYDIASKALSRGKHCFIEKPVTEHSREAIILENLANEHHLKVQIGHVERYNPGFLAVKNSIHHPRFIEAHRLATFNPRGTDVSVVHDLMIHDLDLISVIAQSEPVDIRANGVNIVSPKADICNARIEFKNGLVANVTASRISMKQMRKIRIFQDDAYISLDLLTKEAQIISLLSEYQDQTIELDTYMGKRYVSLQTPEITPVNAILEEIKSFAKSIVMNLPVEVNLTDGIRALKLVEAISQQIEAAHER
ncbi:MAG: Gfo/Idh/MocA family oxidoreductase [Saprospiraceae bacterium]|nr:Gfo/Idh/MocA family oxidoreductase [Saprospiraceae bacterium]